MLSSLKKHSLNNLFRSHLLAAYWYVAQGILQWSLFIASVIDCSPTQSFTHSYYCSTHECAQLIFVNHAMQQSMNMVK